MILWCSGTIGCCGVNKKSKCLLFIYLTLVFLMTILTAATGFVILTYADLIPPTGKSLDISYEHPVWFGSARLRCCVQELKAIWTTLKALCKYKYKWPHLSVMCVKGFGALRSYTSLLLIPIFCLFRYNKCCVDGGFASDPVPACPATPRCISQGRRFKYI